VGTRTVALEDQRLRSYEGGWAEYAQAREDRREAEAAATAAARRQRASPDLGRDDGGGRQGRVETRAPSKNAQRRIAELERDVERAEAALAELEDELADPAMWSSPSRTERSTARHTAAKKAVEQAYARWEEATSNRALPGKP
jgi:ATP-binding cassette subfamily F protein 3